MLSLRHYTRCALPCPVCRGQRVAINPIDGIVAANHLGNAADHGGLGLQLIVSTVVLDQAGGAYSVVAVDDGDEACKHPVAQIVTKKLAQALYRRCCRI